MDFSTDEINEYTSDIVRAVGYAIENAKQSSENHNRGFDCNVLAMHYTNRVETNQETAPSGLEASKAVMLQYALSKQNGICASIGVGVGAASFVLLLAFSTGGLGLLIPLSIAVGMATYSISTRIAYPHYKSTVMKAEVDGGCLKGSRKMVQAQKADGIGNPSSSATSATSSGGTKPRDLSAAPGLGSKTGSR